MARTVSNCSAGEREVNDGSQFVLARNGSGTVTDEHGFYPGGDQPMSVRLPSGRTGVFITDPQLRSTVRAIADADKNATNMEFKTYDISPWGVVAADTGTTTRLRMAGQPYDQGSGLYYMRARYYDPDLGRFLSEDPIGVSGGLNLYAYAGNDPVNAMDPAGLCAVYGTHIRSDVDDPSTDICVDNPAYGDHGGQLTGIPLPQLPTAPNAVPGLAGGGGPGGDVGGGIKLTPCQKAVVTTAVDFVLDVTFLKVARSLERSGTALLRAAERGLHPMLSSTKPYLEVIQTQSLAGFLALMGGDFMHGAGVTEEVGHSVAGAGLLMGATGAGIASWQTAKDGAKFAAGFIPGVGGCSRRLGDQRI